MAEQLKRTPQGEKLRKQGALWIDRIKAAAKLEEDWMDDADIATKAYCGETRSNASLTSSTALGSTYDFNILYSNVETIVPAVINSPPAPDIRRRFSDDDPAAKDVAELIERAIRIQVDDSRLQIELEAEAQDIFLAGRGVIRLRFKSDIVEDPRDAIEDAAENETEDAPPYSDSERDEKDADEEGVAGGFLDVAAVGGRSNGAGERLANERITFEAVSWRDYRHGPAKRWDERPWDAFRFCIPREDENDVFDTNLISSQVDQAEYTSRKTSGGDLTGWEIWCKKTKKVHFIDDDGVMLRTVDDPLQLSQFFPIATPAQAVEVTGRLMPVNPFAVYRRLADELDLTTKRIRVITDQMKVKGWYPGSATDFSNMLDANDAEFVPIADAEIWAQNGGLANAVLFWPIEKFVIVVRELYAAREQTKQAIYEITGISDIVRGASSASETLGAQQIKTQWGSLRIQKMQRMLERTARDLFVMMSEIIPSKFSFETLQAMTGIQLIPTEQDMTPVQPQIQPNTPPEAQQQAMAQAQEAEQARQAKLQKLDSIGKLLNERLATSYRIDVESDSTVKADLTRQKAESAEFLQGAAAYFQAVGPLVQEGALPMDAAVEIFAANARMFNLGKSVEDTLDKMITDAKEKAAQPPQPSPEQQAAEAEAKAREQEMQFKQQDMQMKVAADERKDQRDAAADQRKLQTEQQKAAIDLQKAQVDLQIKMIDLDLKRQEAQLGLQTKAAESDMKLQAQKQSNDLKAQQARSQANGKARQ